MREASYDDEALVVDILTASFDNNISVNFVAKQDFIREKRIRFLMKYSFFIGINFGKIFVSDNQKACCILINSESKKVTFKKLIYDIRLIFNTIGILGIKKVLKREKLLKEHIPQKPFLHLWYIGVSPQYFNLGYGSSLLKEVIAYSEKKQKDIYLETSMSKNINFYTSHGFDQIYKIDKNLLSYELFVFKRTSDII